MEEYIGAPGGENFSYTHKGNYSYNKEIREYYKTLGKKESDGKLSYELDFSFIKQLAERMAQNKDKYEPYNWKKPIDIESLKQSLLRHVIEVLDGKYEDDGRELGHLESIAINAMFLNYQLKK